MTQNPIDAPSDQSTNVIFKSKPLSGIMADQYFDLATPQHFWCRRRFEVVRALFGERIQSIQRAAEIGCGNGVLQRQFEDTYNLSPAGFDLHEAALRQNISRKSKVYCYDIHDRAEEFLQSFDLLLMFDVLEHIEDQDRFLESARFHLAEHGCILINVPALQWLFSPYDIAQGHQRRYSVSSLLEVAKRNGFRVSKATYWGGPLVPVLALRKAALSMQRSKTNSYSTGFDSRGELINSALYQLSGLEVVPQRILGTSVMALLET